MSPSLLRAAFAAGALTLAGGVSAHAHDHATPHTAEADTLPGPAAGEAAPELVLVDQAGATRTLADIAGENGVVVTFVRAADWCPVCQAQLLQLDARADEFAAAGLTLAAVTTDTVDEIAAFAEAREVSLTLLADTDSAVIKAWDVLDPANSEPRVGDKWAHNGLPFPVTFVVTPEGAVAARLLEEDKVGDARGYAARVPVDTILAAAIAASTEAEG